MISKQRKCIRNGATKWSSFFGQGQAFFEGIFHNFLDKLRNLSEHQETNTKSKRILTENSIPKPKINRLNSLHLEAKPFSSYRNFCSILQLQVSD